MSGWWCCGCETCEFFRDDFARGDSTTIANSWVEQSGDFEILSGRLVTSDANSIAYNSTAQPDSDEQMKVAAVLRSDTAGDQLRLIVAYLDSNNYLYAQVEFDAACGELTLWKVVSGTHTQIGDTVPIYGDLLDADYVLTLCYDSEPCCEDDDSSDPCIGTLRAIFNATHYSVAFDVDAPAGGYLVGVGTGALTGTATFDDVFAYKINAQVNCLCRLPTCTIASDTFDRAELGCEWQVLSGAPTVATSALILAAGDAVLSLRPSPRCTNNYKAAWSVTATTDDKIRLYFDYIDSDNYHYVEYTFGLPGLIEIFKREGGVDTSIESEVTDVTGSGDLTICVTGDLIDASGVEVISSMFGGRLVGIGAEVVTIDDIEVADFTYSLVRSSEDIDCVTCASGGSSCTPCDGGLYSTYLKVVVSGMTGANAPNGTHILGPPSIGSSPVVCSWGKLVADVGESVCGSTLLETTSFGVSIFEESGSVILEFTMSQSGGDIDHWRATIGTTTSRPRCQDLLDVSVELFSGFPTICGVLSATILVSAI